MTVVKFSILTLLAGGFCTLLGIGIWMGPQETACNAQTAGVTTVDVAAPCRGCPPAATHAVVATTCDSKAPACSGEACAVAGCASEGCDLVSAPFPADEAMCATGCPTSELAGPQLPAANPYTISHCESGVCIATTAPCPTALPSLAGPVCAPGAPCPPAPYPTWGPAPSVAPVVSASDATIAYAHQYGVAPAFVAAAVPAPVGPSYAYADASSNGPTHQELIEAIFEEREARYEAQIEALQAQMQLQLEAGEAIFKAQHEAELTKIKAEAAIEIADLKRSMREQEGLLRHVAAGTISQEALQAIVAGCDANAAAETLPVSTAAACKCEKRCGETCKRCTEGESCACTTCKCEGCACPGCEKTVSIKTTCTTGECTACPTACATCAKSCEACTTCAKECDAYTLTAKSLELIGVDFDCQGKNCRIVVGQKAAACPNGACTTGKCEAKRPAAVATPTDPFVCEKDGCELKLEEVEGMPILSKIPYINKLFQGQTSPSTHYTTDDIQYFPPAPEFKPQQEEAQQE